MKVSWRLGCLGLLRGEVDGGRGSGDVGPNSLVHDDAGCAEDLVAHLAEVDAAAAEEILALGAGLCEDGCRVGVGGEFAGFAGHVG